MSKKTKPNANSITSLQMRQLAESVNEKHQRLSDILRLIEDVARQGEFTLLIHFDLKDFEKNSLKKRGFKLVNRVDLPVLGIRNVLFHSIEIQW